MVMDMDALCNHLDSLVGVKVAEVIIGNLEIREGREEAELFRRENPRANVEEIITLFIRYDALTGVGITKITFPKQTGNPILVEIANPYVKKRTGSSKMLLFSWWCGVLSTLLDRHLDIQSVIYDERSDVVRSMLVSR